MAEKVLAFVETSMSKYLSGNMAAFDFDFFLLNYVNYLLIFLFYYKCEKTKKKNTNIKLKIFSK